MWLRETDRSLVANLEKPLLGDSAPDARIQGIDPCNVHEASLAGRSRLSTTFIARASDTPAPSTACGRHAVPVSGAWEDLVLVRGWTAAVRRMPRHHAAASAHEHSGARHVERFTAA